MKKIVPPLWIKTPESRLVMEILNGASYESGHSESGMPKALFVGGCVRNTLLGKDVYDIDIATKLSPETVMALFQKKGIKVIPTGVSHGTVTVVINKKSFEITTLRRDIQTDGRHAIVDFTEDWAEDAARRDFTMNTLLADGLGHIYDPTERGIEDLKAGRVVFVGQPEQRIAEDYLRILRFFRFYALYGRGEPDAAALQACRQTARHITTLSRERITQEFFKIMMAENADVVLEIMFKNNILNCIFNIKYNQKKMARLVTLQCQYQWMDVVARCAILTDDLYRLEEHLLFSKKQKSNFLLYINILNNISNVKNKDIKRLIYCHGTHPAGQAVLLYSAFYDMPVDVSWMKDWRPPVFPVTGDDIIKSGIPSGMAVGHMLAALEQWWLDHDMNPDRQACLQQLAVYQERALKKD